MEKILVFLEEENNYMKSILEKEPVRVRPRMHVCAETQLSRTLLKKGLELCKIHPPE